MSAALQSIVDPTRGHNLVSVRSDNLEQPRYLFFAGNVLDPDRVYQLEHLRDSGGGEEVQAHCLRRSVGGFIQRGSITPMEVWAEPMPPVLIGEGAERDTVRIQGPTTPEMLGASSKRPGGLAGVGAALAHVKFYPGDEIGAVLRAHEGKGIVEVKALIGQGWYEDEAETKPGLPQLLNYDFFPTRPPVTLSGLREMIDKKKSDSEVHKAVATDMLTSCGQFERWAQARLAAEHTLLRQRTSPNGQHTYTYSPIAYELLKQLEVKPQDNILDSMGGINAAQLQQIVSSVGGGGQLDASAIGIIAGEVAKQFLAAQKVSSEADTLESQPKGARQRKKVDATEPDNGGGEN